MALFQTGSGYRDATKALTIKALQERQKQAAAQMSAAQSAPDVTADPLSAVSHVLNTMGAGFQQSRADSREADARQQLSQIMAKIDPNTGPTQQQIAEMQVLDPEFANKQYESAIAERRKIADREDQQQYGTSERVAGQEYGTGERVAGQEYGTSERVAQEATARDVAAQADVVRDENAVSDADIALKRAKQDAVMKEAEGKVALLLESGAIDEAEAQRQIAEIRAGRTAEVTTAEAGATEAVQQASPATPVSPEEAAKWGGDVERNPSDYYIDPADNRPHKLSEYNAGAAAQRKDVNTSKNDLATIDAGLNEMTRALELVDSILPGGTLGKGYADIAGMDPTGLLGGPGTDATKRFYQIIEGSALKTMSAELKGATALGELKKYIDILADPNTSTDVKKQTIASIMAKLRAGREITRQQLADIGGGDPGEWTYANPDVAPGTTDTTQPPAPAATPDDPAGIRPKK